MPYIRKERRPAFDPHLESVVQEIQSAGELNYALTYILRGVRAKEGTPSYASFNLTTGAVVNALIEDYITQVLPYERSARAINGDVRPGRELDGHGEVAREGS